MVLSRLFEMYTCIQSSKFDKHGSNSTWIYEILFLWGWISILGIDFVLKTKFEKPVPQFNCWTMLETHWLCLATKDRCKEYIFNLYNNNGIPNDTVTSKHTLEALSSSKTSTFKMLAKVLQMLVLEKPHKDMKNMCLAIMISAVQYKCNNKGGKLCQWSKEGHKGWFMHQHYIQVQFIWVHTRYESFLKVFWNWV